MDLKPKEDVKSEEWKSNKELYPTWHKVGKVRAMYLYPLLKGSPESVDTCCIYRNQLCGYLNKTSVLNEMFVVYDEVSRAICTANEVHELNTFTVLIMDHSVIALRVHSNSIALILPKIVANGNVKTLVTSFYNKFIVFVSVLDCGDVVANWLRRNTNNNRLRLGFIHDLGPQKFEKAKEDFEGRNLFKSDSREFMMLFERVPSVRLVTCETFDEIVHSCSYEQLQQLNPNIIISSIGQKPFNEKKWKKIKIGNHVVVNNVYNINLEDSPTSQINLKDMPIDLQWEMLLLHCEVVCSGVVEEDDEVFALYDSGDDEEVDS
ncbi:uncharacterized protein LOC116847796 [Odontomachus brunneus]|uniref:uncharacterized protein LOC116847796 n=1 Tax=Odontomachus brunneus TaxID=486640 RepID=UPI0013F27D54|nr:uncharacterized protein LOC116847796 [Odontomachus brunneus]